MEMTRKAKEEPVVAGTELPDDNLTETHRRRCQFGSMETKRVDGRLKYLSRHK
jgi:hypothetical protein